MEARPSDADVLLCSHSPTAWTSWECGHLPVCPARLPPPCLHPSLLHFPHPGTSQPPRLDHYMDFLFLGRAGSCPSEDLPQMSLILHLFVRPSDGTQSLDGGGGFLLAGGCHLSWIRESKQSIWATVFRHWTLGCTRQ